MSIFLRWGVPAFVTVVGGTAAAVATSGAAIPLDLASRTGAAIATATWAEVSFDGRDAIVSGTASSTRMIDEAVATVAAVHGVRSVTSRATVAEQASPFAFVATIVHGQMTLSGALPDEAARPGILAAAGQGAIDELKPMSGVPGRTEWLAAVDYALAYARELDEGEVALSDLAVTVSGRARSQQSLSTLERLAAGPTPAGVEVAFHEFTPPLLSPYEWRADYDGKRLSLSGATPAPDVTAGLLALAPTDIPVSTSLVLASGEPAGFADTARALLENLLQLEQGSAEISGDASTLDGVPVDDATAEAVRVAMTTGGTRVTLAPPLVEQYQFTAERTGSGIVLDGFVPGEGLRTRLDARDGVDATSLELGRGAPDRFEAGVDFIVEALGRMSEGRGSISGTSISLEGRAATAADYIWLETALDLGAPQGLVLAAAAVKPPFATPFTFAVEKAADGAFTVSGHVPSAQSRKRLLAALPAAADDRTAIADGNPSGFDSAAVSGVELLALLDSGTVAYDGTGWSLTGTVNGSAEAFAAESAFAAAGLRAAGWSYTVAVPQAPSTAALPVIDPYVWRARKAAGGAITLSGFVPTSQLKAYLSVHAGSDVTDGTSVGAGAPESFVTDAVAALDALLAMEEGSVGFSAGEWTLGGTVKSTPERQRIEGALHGATDASRWHIAIQAADAAPTVTPFVWSATRAADGTVTISGYIPSDTLRTALARIAGSAVIDKTLVGSGEPAGFAQDAQAGLAALLRLQSGELRYDGAGWSISGQPKTVAEVEAVQSAISAMSDGGDGWTQALAAPLQPATTADPATVETAPEAPADVAAIAPEPVAPVDRNFVFAATKVLGGPVAFNGAVPAEPMRRYLAVITSTEPAEALAISSSLPGDFIPNAEAGSRALASLADGEFGLSGDTWVFSGRAETEAQRQAALDQLGAAPPGSRWETSVTLLPPFVVCKDKVGALASRNAILFQSGSATIAPASFAAIDELVADLALCPEATVEVEGHTDSDGDDQANLALSVFRAEAVVEALIARGVSPDRLYAIGYGESLPVASNDTRAGKQANRRIAFTLSER